MLNSARNITSGGQLKALIKVPLILVSVFIIFRIILEEMGFTTPITNIFGVIWLNFLVPIYLVFQLEKRSSLNWFKNLFAVVFFFTLCTRLMVMITYMLAYVLGWKAIRFSVEGGGGVGADSLMQGMIFIPFINLLLSVFVLTIIGVLLGSITLLIRRRTVSL